MRSSFASGRDQAQRWARDLLARQDWVILDTETTGLGRAAEVIQIAIVGPDGGPLLDTLVRPLGLIPPDATAIHGITDGMVEGAPTFASVQPILRTVLSGKLVVCYNAAFDRRMLRQTALRNQLPDLSNGWDCAMEQYARYAGGWSSRSGRPGALPLPRRPELRDLKHQAIVDCLATLDVIRRMAAE